MKRTRTRLYRGTTRNIKLLANQLRQGDLVAVPTETVYGLAANALDPVACAKIFKAKGRPTTDPLIVHIHDLAQLATIARPNPSALRLAQLFWPGPLTLILPKTRAVPALITAGKTSVAVRMPAHPLFRQLLRQCGLPLAAPSANPFGYVSPTSAQHVRNSLAGRIPFILDGGPAPIGVESTILDLRNPSKPRLLRPGAITVEQLQSALKCTVAIKAPRIGQTKTAQLAPGQLKQHYSPKAEVVLHTRIPDHLRRASNAKQALLYFQKPAHPSHPHAHWLSTTGHQGTAARNLFAKLRELDQAHYSTIHVELAPDGAMAAAINDRLRRAAAQGPG